MEFLKLNEVKLNPAGYLVAVKSNKPVTNAQFVKEQEAAHYIVELSKAIKDKNFKSQNADSYAQIEAEVRRSINASKVEQYVTAPKEPKSKVVDELTNHALDFLNYTANVEKTSNINIIMNEFNSINGVETTGDYFVEGLVKLKAIYSIKEILTAVELREEKLS